LQIKGLGVKRPQKRTPNEPGFGVTEPKKRPTEPRKGLTKLNFGLEKSGTQIQDSAPDCVPLTLCLEMGCHSERSEECRPGLSWVGRPTRSKIPRFARNDISCFQSAGQPTGMSDCLCHERMPRGMIRLIAALLRKGCDEENNSACRVGARGLGALAIASWECRWILCCGADRGSGKRAGRCGCLELARLAATLGAAGESSGCACPRPPTRSLRPSPPPELRREEQDKSDRTGGSPPPAGSLALWKGNPCKPSTASDIASLVESLKTHSFAESYLRSALPKVAGFA
jgi:hypothetical protein